MKIEKCHQEVSTLMCDLESVNLQLGSYQSDVIVGSLVVIIVCPSALPYYFGLHIWRFQNQHENEMWILRGDLFLSMFCSGRDGFAICSRHLTT